MLTLSLLKTTHPTFFDRKTCRFFGDREYKVLTHKDGTKYLVRHTAQWSDMLGGPKQYRYRLNPIGPAPEYRILSLVDQEFSTLPDVKHWLRQ